LGVVRRPTCSQPTAYAAAAAAAVRATTAARTASATAVYSAEGRLSWFMLSPMNMAQRGVSGSYSTRKVE
jgi:hypothetical protein